MGYFDADGDLWIVQRRTDLIISGGENVYPSEVEGVLERHPDIEEACVIGLDHPVWGQQIAAALVLHEGRVLSTKNIEQHCRTLLAGYKIPRVIQFVNTFPRTASGKIIRSRVRQIFDQS
jgi:acyl-CoA synthetase (AMP-forming)/AMP-acid ligase II